MSYTDAEIRDLLEEFPHAGGEYYSEQEGKLDPATADVTVTTVSGFIDAVGPNHTVLVDSNLDLTGEQVDIGQSTVMGDRGWDGSDGALLYTNTEGYVPSPWSSNDRPYTMLYSTTTDGAPRVTGLRLRGASHDREDPAPAGDSDIYEENLARGITFRGDAAEVDNCEIYGFMWNQIHAKGWSSINRWTEVDVHHCHLHTAMQDGYGYGVDFWRGYGTVEFCYINETRHSIDGQGLFQCSYDSFQNLFGPDQRSHMIDMHCLTENSISCQNTDPDATDYGIRAGGEVNAHECTFLHGSSAVGTCRGIPWIAFRIYDNWISHDEIPTHNSGNNRSGAWYQQNIHGVTGDCGESYPSHAPDGEYTDEWADYNNRLGADDPSVTWEDSHGCDVAFESPASSPAYHGYDTETEPDPEYDLTVVVEDIDANPLDHATVTFEGEEHAVNSAGEVVFTDLEEGDYVIEASAEGWFDGDTTVTLTSDHVETLQLEDNPDEWFRWTDVDGIADFGAHDYDAPFTIRVEMEGYYSKTVSYVNDSDDPLLIELRSKTAEDGSIRLSVRNVKDEGIGNVEARLFEASD